MDAIDRAIERFARSSRPMAKTRPKYDVSGAPFLTLCEHHNRLCWSTANCEPEPAPEPAVIEDFKKVTVVDGYLLAEWILNEGGSISAEINGEIDGDLYYVVYLLGPDELVGQWIQVIWPLAASANEAYRYAVKNALALARADGLEFHPTKLS